MGHACFGYITDPPVLHVPDRQLPVCPIVTCVTTTIFLLLIALSLLSLSFIVDRQIYENAAKLLP